MAKHKGPESPKITAQKCIRKPTSPLVAIVGETASGKTALALDIAERHNGEIICADSRTVYRYMDIGTAKPTPEERARVSHHLLDVAEPGQGFTLADFQTLAKNTISDIQNRGKLPLLVGGSGLYIDSVLFNFEMPPAVDPSLRAELEELAIEDLQRQLTEKGLPLPENSKNKRYLIRAIERGGVRPARSPRPDTLVIGISLPQDILESRIRQRAEAMFGSGVIQETETLIRKYGSGCEQFKGSIYAVAVRYLAGELNKTEFIEAFVRSDLRLAKKQRTWFKRHKEIIWVSTPAEAEQKVTHFLAGLQA